MMKSIRKIILPFLLVAPLITSCSNDNQVISGDFTVGEAKKYAKDYLNLVFNKDSLEGHEINILLNLGRSNGNKGIILLMSYRPIDINEGMSCEYSTEKIGNYTFDWDKSYKLNNSCQAARYYADDKVYTLTEAFKDNLLDIGEIRVANERLSHYSSIDGVEINYKFTNKID